MKIKFNFYFKNTAIRKLKFIYVVLIIFLLDRIALDSYASLFINTY